MATAGAWWGGYQGGGGQPRLACGGIAGRRWCSTRMEGMRRRIDHSALDVTAASALGAGWVWAWRGWPCRKRGNTPFSAKLLGQGVTDMLRITDGWISGTAFGTWALHVAPESAVLGPFYRFGDWDMLSLDAYAGSLSVLAYAAQRRQPAPSVVSDGWAWPANFNCMHVLQAPEGCDYNSPEVLRLSNFYSLES